MKKILAEEPKVCSAATRHQKGWLYSSLTLVAYSHLPQAISWWWSFGRVSIFGEQSVQGGQISTDIRQRKQQDLASTGEHDHPFWYQVVLLTRMEDGKAPKTVCL